MNFRVGQKVVCVGGGSATINAVKTATPIQIGHVYTVREIDPVYLPCCGMVGVRVVEVVNERVPWAGIMLEPAWLADNFRPAVERKTDIAIFTKLLTPSRDKVTA